MADEAGQAALDALREAFAAITRVIAAIPDPQQAFELATELQALEREHGKLTTQIRARAAGRIWESEKMSLGELARRTKVTKARADQFVHLGKSQEGEDA